MASIKQPKGYYRGRQEEAAEVQLATSRKQLSVARKNKSIQATSRCAILFGYIKEKKWDDLLHKLDYYESDATEWIEEKNDDGTTRWRSLLIHLVCERKPPAEVVRQLLRIHPKSAGTKNYGGDLPIHIACRENASKEVIEIILNSDNYECAKVKDCEGRLPLHLAASNTNVSVKTIRNLITVFDRATRSPDDFSLLPLHWACSKNASPRVIETIIQAYPYAVEAKDAWGRTPLSLAKTSKNPEKAVILELLSRDISSWTTAMMSTVVTLSNKVLEAEKMETEFKERASEVGNLKQLNEQKEKRIDALKLELKLLEERFVDDILYLKKKHAAELEKQKEESDEVIAQITKEKEEAEQKLVDLKELVRDLISQLKHQKALVEDKEVERKSLKERAVALLQKIERQKQQTLVVNEENMKLKLDKVDLQARVDDSAKKLKQLKTVFQQPMQMLNEVKSREVDEDPYFERQEYSRRRDNTEYRSVDYERDYRDDNHKTDEYISDFRTHGRRETDDTSDLKCRRYEPKAAVEGSESRSFDHSVEGKASASVFPCTKLDDGSVSMSSDAKSKSVDKEPASLHMCNGDGDESRTTNQGPHDEKYSGARLEDTIMLPDVRNREKSKAREIVSEGVSPYIHCHDIDDHKGHSVSQLSNSIRPHCEEENVEKVIKYSVSRVEGDDISRLSNDPYPLSNLSTKEESYIDKIMKASDEKSHQSRSNRSHRSYHSDNAMPFPEVPSHTPGGKEDETNDIVVPHISAKSLILNEKKDSLGRLSEDKSCGESNTREIFVQLPTKHRPHIMHVPRLQKKLKDGGKWIPAATSGYLENYVKSLVFSVDEFVDTKLKCNLGVALYNKTGQFVARCIVFRSRTKSSKGLFHVITSDQNIVSKAEPGYFYQLQYAVDSGHQDVLKVKGWLCKVFTGGDAPLTSYYMTDKDGDNGYYFGPVNKKDQAHGDGYLEYENGCTFVGKFEDGHLLNGAYYKVNQIQATMKDKKWTEEVNSDLQHAYPQKLQGFKLEVRPEDIDHGNDNRSKPSSIDLCCV